ncbi:MAG TPA: hypothetical protein VIJ46_06705 [Rhabdochlamydiaceae bacterium]
MRLKRAALRGPHPSPATAPATPATSTPSAPIIDLSPTAQTPPSKDDEKNMADLQQGGGSQGQGEEVIVEDTVMEEVPVPDADAAAKETHTLAETSVNDVVDAAKTSDQMAEKKDEAEASKERAPESSAHAKADKERAVETVQHKEKEPVVQPHLHVAPAAQPSLAAIRQTSGPRLPTPADLVKAADSIVSGADKFCDNAMTAAATMKRVAKVNSLHFLYYTHILHCSPRALRRKTIGIFVLML